MTMDDLSKEYIVSFFNQSLRMHGDRPEAVRWSAGGQVQHYEALLDIGDLRGKEILDFGCGKGDFCRFLRDRGIETFYTGIDINEVLIALAREKFPGVEFRVLDIDREDLAADYDYIFLCGVFNLKIQGLDTLIPGTLEKLFSHCRTGLAFNALSDHCPSKDFELHYVNPEEMFRFAVRNLSPYVALRHDRKRYDFDLFVYRSPVRGA